MSDFMESDLPQEVRECMEAFDIQRQMVYDWLGERTAQDINVFTYASKAGELVSALSEVFAETSSTIADTLRDERRIAGYLITSAWYIDSGDRINFLRKRVPSYVELSTPERPVIEKKVDLILDQSDDVSDIYNSLGASYFAPAAKDFGNLLTACHRAREMRILGMTVDMPRSQPDALHYETTAEQIGVTTAQDVTSWLAKYMRAGA